MQVRLGEAVIKVVYEDENAESAFYFFSLFTATLPIPPRVVADLG
jgi:hypothetical protein